MGVSEILEQLDREIAQLQQARALLTGDTAGQQEVLFVFQSREKETELDP